MQDAGRRPARPDASPTLIGALVPPGLATAEILGHGPAEPLLPEEERAIGTVAASRRRDVTRGRSCARRALAVLGRPATAILPGPGGRPLWPAGIVGSITHCDGYAGAAVARESRFRSVGIDAEPHRPLPPGLISMVARPEERHMLAGLPTGTCWDRLLFSAKESVFKAWFPLAGSWLDFHEAAVTIDPIACSFEAVVLKAHPALQPRHMAGRFRVAGDLVLSAIAIRAIG